MMVKHILAILVISIIVLFAQPYLNDALTWLMNFHTWMKNLLSLVFAGNYLGTLVTRWIPLS